MSKICALCLSLALVAASWPAAALGHERRLPRANSLLTKKLSYNLAAPTHGPARIHSDTWGRGRVTFTKAQRGMSMPHLNPR